MADFQYNQSCGRAQELVNRVNNNDPANSAFVLVAIVANAVTDATLKDLDDLAAVLATAANEATNTDYARIVLTDASGTTTAVDDTNDRRTFDMPDQTFVGVDAGDNWTDLILCYDSDTTAGTDANIVPLLQYDFAVTPDGTNITVVVNANGLLRST